MRRSAVLLNVLGIGMVCQAIPATAFGQAKEYVYVETNIKTGNSIAAFSRGKDGQLQALPGSPFLTGGAGTAYAGLNVGPDDTDQSVITNRDHTLLFAVNSGSDSIAVFRIQSDGSLVPVLGSPFPSGGNDPVSLDLVNDILFVVNKSGDPARPTSVLPNYTTLLVQRDGILIPTSSLANDGSRPIQSTVSVAIGSSPTQAHVVPNTNLMFGTDFLGGLVQRFQFDWNGNLQQLAPLAISASEYSDTKVPRLPLGVWHHPTAPLIYVGFVTDSKLGVYRYGQDGSLKFLRAVPNSGAAICWIRINTTGTRLYTSNTTSNSISVYDVTDAAYPVQVQEFPLSGLGNVLQFSLSDDGRSLYALSTRGSASIPEGQGNILHVLTVAQDGTVAETLNPVVFHVPNDTRPQGVAVVPGR